MSNVQIEGIDKIIAKLENLKNVDTIPVAMAGAYKILSGAQQRAPVKTGYLRQSGFVEEVEDGAEIGFSAEYAWYQEFGTSKMPAQPYLRPTLDEDADEIIKVMQDKINKQIEEANK